MADPNERRGLIWHTQGSGKTLTMITIASRLLRNSSAVKPTVLMLVDRTELEAQLFKNIAAYGIGTIEIAQSKADLQHIFKSDYRGLVVSMIHKFDDIPADINTREGVVVLVDEAHRTTGGDLGNYLMAALPNATYIGFTGTPVDTLHQGKGTFKVFGGSDPQGYLDKYSIAESITDGTTVQLNYALAPSEMRVDRETLDREFLNLRDAEGVADVEELNAVLSKAVVLKEMMKSPARVAKIAAFVANHFRENVEPMGFKAFIVAVDREACVLYKRELDKHLPPDYSQVVYSPSHNDSVDLKEYYLSPEREKEVRKAFTKKDEQPKILIVTEKLLTGFDAPILYCMYLDKPMRDHVLLQAIARVNRPYEDEDGLIKPIGFVLDFVGIFERIKDALAFDSDIVGSVIQNLDVLKELFARMMAEKATVYLPLAKGWDDKAKERAAAYFADSAVREEFFGFFKQVQSLYDILSPDAFLRPYIDDFSRLAELYQLVRSAYADSTYVDKEFTEKVKALVRNNTDMPNLELPGAIHQLGPQELAALRESDTDETTKVLNLMKILQVTVEKNGDQQPFLLAIGERAQQLADSYEDRQLTTQQALDAFQKLAQEAVDAGEQRKELEVDENTFAILVALRPIAQITAEQAGEVNALFVAHPDYVWNQAQGSDLRTALYKVLRPLVGAGKLIESTNIVLKLRRV